MTDRLAVRVGDRGAGSRRSRRRPGRSPRRCRPRDAVIVDGPSVADDVDPPRPTGDRRGSPPRRPRRAGRGWRRDRDGARRKGRRSRRAWPRVDYGSGVGEHGVDVGGHQARQIFHRPVERDDLAEPGPADREVPAGRRSATGRCVSCHFSKPGRQRLIAASTARCSRERAPASESCGQITLTGICSTLGRSRAAGQA